MRERNDSNNSLRTSLNQMSVSILAVISFISGVYGFVKLFADKDAGLITLISLTVGILLLLGGCLYYAKFWQPEKQDRGQSAFSPTSDEQVKAQAKKERDRKWIRRSAIAGLIAIPILSFSGVAGWFYVQSLPTKNIIVLVADFDGPDPKTYRVTEAVNRQLHQATEKYADVEIQSLNKPITEQEGSKVARTEGEKRKATIVIWGWYSNPGNVALLSAHFEVLHPPKYLPELKQNARGNIQQAAIADLKSFTLQTRLSTEMNYLSLFTLGMTRFAAGDQAGAIARFSDALNQKTDSSSSLNQSLVYFYRGTGYLQKGEYNLALADFTQTIKLYPNFAEAYNNRGLIYLTTGKYDQAIADFTQAIKLHPNFAEAHNNRGIIYLTTGKYDQAIADFNQTLKLLPKDKDAVRTLHPNDSQLKKMSSDWSNLAHPVNVVNVLVLDMDDYIVYNNRGMAFLSKSDYDRAITDFNQAIKLQPDRAFAYFNRSSVYFFKKDYDHSLVDLNQVIKLQPDFALAYLKRGSTYYFKGDFDRALADINQAIKLQPNSASVYVMRGELYIKRGDFDRALADINQAIKLQPNSASLYEIRGEVYIKRGDFDRAFADISQAIKLQPNSASVYVMRGALYREKGDYDRAFADLDRAFKLKPDDAQNYNARGWTYAQKGDFDRALVDLDRAIELKPDGAEIYDSRGFAYAGKHDYSRAIADYNQALKLQPDADYAYLHRGIVYRALGDRPQAIADFKKTLELTKNSKRHQEAEKQLQELGAK
jgi:tetratricopeptide (TPR) repeat protein